MPRLLAGGTPELAARLAPRLREADRLEIERGCGLPPLECLTRSLAGTRNAFWIEGDDGEIEALGGGSPLSTDPRVGVPWMLGSDFITRRRTWFLRHTPDIWATVSKDYDWLFNIVDAKNTVHRRWLEWSGCRFGNTRILNGNPFIEFSKSCANQSASR